MLWNLHSLSCAYGGRPSSYLGLNPESWETYQFDLACLHVGRDIEERIRNKRPLPWQDGQRRPRGGFGRLGARARKVQIPESGIW